MLILDICIWPRLKACDVMWPWGLHGLSLTGRNAHLNFQFSPSLCKSVNLWFLKKFFLSHLFFYFINGILKAKMKRLLTDCCDSYVEDNGWCNLLWCVALTYLFSKWREKRGKKPPINFHFIEMTKLQRSQTLLIKSLWPQSFLRTSLLYCCLTQSIAIPILININLLISIKSRLPLDQFSLASVWHCRPLITPRLPPPSSTHTHTCIYIHTHTPSFDFGVNKADRLWEHIDSYQKMPLM